MGWRSSDGVAKFYVMASATVETSAWEGWEELWWEALWIAASCWVVLVVVLVLVLVVVLVG